MVSRKEIQDRREFPIAPIRHMDVMDKLARCRFCDRLCCCLEHLAVHENRHLTTKGTKQAIYEKSEYSSEYSEWVEATELVLHSSKRKINFPLFCIYCKITIKNEQELRRLMTDGPRCSVKESHWIISFKKYLEKTSNRNTLLVIEETKKSPIDSAISFASTNFSINHFTHSHITPRDNFSQSVGRMKPISTSTPQDGCEPSTSEKDLSSLAAELTPIGLKTANAPHSILAVKSEQKPKGEGARKVTFSCIVETANNSTVEANSSDNKGSNEKETCENKIDCGKKLEEVENYSTEREYKYSEKIETQTFKNKNCDRQFMIENADQNICDDHKPEGDNKTNVDLEENENPLKYINGNLDHLNGMGLIDKSNKAVQEELEGKELNDVENNLEIERCEGLEVPKISEINNEDRTEDETVERSLKEKMTDSQLEEMHSQNTSLDESGENPSQSIFYSEEESADETNRLENEYFGSSDDYFKEFKEGNTGSKLGKAQCKISEDSKNMQMLSYQFSGQKYTKTSTQVQIESNDNSESEPLLIAKESLDVHTNCEDYLKDSLPLDADYDEYDTATNLPCSEGNISSDGEQSNENNIEKDKRDEEWSLTKLKSALSYSWGKAKELVMQSWGTKRNNMDNTEEENDENCAKRMKISHSCPRSDPSSNSSFVQWKCRQRPVRSTEYLSISKRRPLSRMMKK